MIVLIKKEHEDITDINILRQKTHRHVHDNMIIISSILKTLVHQLKLTILECPVGWSHV